jgi:hypothetical protein
VRIRACARHRSQLASHQRPLAGSSNIHQPICRARPRAPCWLQAPTRFCPPSGGANDAESESCSRSIPTWRKIPIAGYGAVSRRIRSLPSMKKAICPRVVPLASLVVPLASPRCPGSGRFALDVGCSSRDVCVVEGRRTSSSRAALLAVASKPNQLDGSDLCCPSRAAWRQRQDRLTA